MKRKRHLKAIHYRTISHKDHRYPTIGDYWETSKAIEVRVSELADWRREALVLIHELVEIFLLKHRGVALRVTDDFDIMFEREREAGKHGSDEPGDDRRCPYRNEHRFAENIERLLAHQLGIVWSDYESEAEAL